MRRRNATLLYSLLLVVLLVSCGKSYEEKQQMTREQRREMFVKDSLSLKIATTPTMDCLPLFIAMDDSLFQQCGVDVHLRLRTNHLDGDTLLAGGWVEGATTDLFRAERLQRKGTPLRYLAATNAYWQLISNRQARIRELDQLSDKMIAMTRYSVTDYLADYAIDSAKPKYDVFRVQINDVHIRLKMLLNNEMDAMLLTEPQATTARINGNPVLMDTQKKNMRFGVIVFREKALKDKRIAQQVKRFTEVYNAMCDSINKNGLQHYAAVIKKYTGADGKTIKALPKLKYQHATAPRQRDITIAKKKG